jgi:L-2-hydroxyglutarate oxidase LhgO
MISERLKDCSLESSDALNNAGTGHAGYYPHSQFLDVIVDEVKFDFMEDYVKFYIEESKRKYKTKKEIIDNTQIVLNNRGIGVTKKHIRELLNKND